MSRQIAQNGGDELVGIVQTECAIESPLEPDRRRWLATQSPSANRTGESTGPHLDVIR
jgi:hypothetical protein